MKKHFVTFLSPGTFVSESTERPIDSWDVEAAKEMAKTIKERHNTTPYGFRFTTRERGENDLDSKVSATSPIYFLGGKVETLAEVKARATAADRILISNMECNGYARIITNANSWKMTVPLGDNDVVLDWPVKRAAYVRLMGDRYIVSAGAFVVAMLTLAELEELHQNAGFALANAPAEKAAA